MMAANERRALAFSLSGGEAGDAPEGRKLLSKTLLSAQYLVMDRAYEDDQTRTPSPHSSPTRWSRLNRQAEVCLFPC